MNERQLGTFEISIRLIKEEPDAVASILSMLNVVPIRAEAMFERDVIEYKAISSAFDEVLPGEKAPEYRIIISNKDGKVASVTAERL